MEYRVEIHPVQFMGSKRTVRTIHIICDGQLVGMANQRRTAATLLTVRKVPVAEAFAAIDKAKADFEERLNKPHAEAAE